jgi:hypothetical protein
MWGFPLGEATMEHRRSVRRRLDAGKSWGSPRARSHWVRHRRGATTVTDEATFRAAWTNAAETKIDLAADITLTCTDGAGDGVSVRNSTTAITVNGHGHTIPQTCTTARITVCSNGTAPAR